MFPVIGMIIFSWGVTYIINLMYNLPDAWWFFVSVMIMTNGFYFTVKKWRKGRNLLFPVSLLIFGIAEALFSLNVVYYSFYTFLAAVFTSIGIGLIVSEFTSKRHSPKILALGDGLIMASLAVIDPFLNEKELFDRVVVYSLGGLVAIVGLFMFFSSVSRKREK